uniref:NSFL1 cofactor p47-like isoform X1 n=1 Tax=Myxine glutinosa TaxID=7769 RepID=UPI00358F0772
MSTPVESAEPLSEFVAVTGVDAERARFFLESSGWDLQLALASFFEDGGDECEEVVAPVPMSSGQPSVSSSSARITRLDDLNTSNQDDSDDEGQRFYAGGSEHSGQQIVGPPRRRGANEIVDHLFKEAKEHGAVPVESTAGLRGSKTKMFSGGGYRLGTPGDDSSSSYVSGGHGAGALPDMHVVLKLWRNGFNLNNGELREYDDPSSSLFLSAIKRGEVPQELQRRARGAQVSLDMQDHRDQDYVVSQQTFQAFSGQGQKLGSPAPHVVGETSREPAVQVQAADAMVEVDESAPTTTLQIRFADGSRLLQRFNHTHRLADLRRFVEQARPASSRCFVLMTTFPNKELNDDEQTLQQLNLLNAVIVQRVK